MVSLIAAQPTSISSAVPRMVVSSAKRDELVGSQNFVLLDVVPEDSHNGWAFPLPILFGHPDHHLVEYIKQCGAGRPSLP